MSSTRRRLRGVWLGGLFAMIGSLLYGLSPASQAGGTGALRPVRSQSQSVTVRPTLAKDFRAGKPVSAAQREALTAKIHATRLAMASRVKAAAGTDRVRTPRAASSREVPAKAAMKAPRLPGDFVIGKNVQDTPASCTTGICSSLAEPAAANEGSHVLMSGNFNHLEFSTNGGTTWTSQTYSAGPTDAPIQCCDTDVIYDHSRAVTFYTMLYINSSTTNGVIRIFVRRNMSLGANCSYTIDPGGTANNVLPDYPHLGLSNNFVYFSANKITSGTTWSGAMLERLSAQNMADCVSASGNVITFTGPVGQRILTPGHGARDVMYAAWVENSTNWRVFSWADSSSSVFQNLLPVGAMTFGNPDCRGGTLNNDWADSLEAGIVGFDVRVAIGNDRVSAFAATAADASHTQAHIHGAIWRIGSSQTSYTLQSQPVVFNSTFCTGIPIVGANDRGDLGLSIAVGGKAGGGGTAAHADVFMIDEFSPGPGGFTLSSIVSGTHNRTDSRYGDYYTVRRNAPCGEFFDATGYALSGGTSSSNVNSRYVEFGRGRDNPCYTTWKAVVPA